jgi:hypothetical protein
LRYDKVADRSDTQAGTKGLHLTVQAFPLFGFAESHDHFVGFERLLQAIVGALSHRCERDIFAPGAAQHDHRASSAFGPEPAQEVEPIGAGKLYAAEDNVEFFSGGTGERALRVALGLDHVARVPEELYELPGSGVVLNDQQSHRSHPP